MDLRQDVTVVQEQAGAPLPSAFSLHQNAPNPFNSQTCIAYDLPEAGDVVLTVFSITGQQVGVLVDAPQEAGHHTVLFDGSKYAI